MNGIILLQGAYSAGLAFLLMPLVVLAHLCVLHYFYGLFKNDYINYPKGKKIWVWLGGVALLGVALIAIPIWSLLSGLVTVSIFMTSKAIAITLLVAIFLGLLYLEAKNVYDQNFKDKSNTFSQRNFGYSVLISLGLLLGALCLIISVFSGIQL